MDNPKTINLLEEYEVHVRRVRVGFLFLGWSFLWFALYIVGMFTSELLSNVSTSLFMLGLTFSAFWVFLHLKSSRFIWFFLFLMLGVWALGDILWMIVAFNQLDPSVLPWLENIYSMSNAFMFIAVGTYFIGNFKKWRGIQLALDLSVILSLIMIILLRLYIPQKDPIELFTHNFWTLGILIFTDVGTVLLLMALMTSGREGKVSHSVVLLLMGLITYASVDMQYVYYYLRDTYVANGLMDLHYLLSLFLIAAAGINEMVRPGRAIHLQRFSPLEFKTTRIIWLFLFVPIILTILNYLEMIDLFLCLFSVLLYYFISHYLQKSMMIEALLEKERYSSIHLEGLVEERTRQLVEANHILEMKSKTDSLTGLANRESLVLQMRNGINGISGSAEQFSILHIDIDRFKVVNDIHGHDMGDQVLIAIGKVIDETVSADYAEHDYILARIGGDEFGVLLRVNCSDALQILSERLIEAMKQPISIAHFRFYFSITIGVARYPQDGETPEALVKSADIAMNHAKNSHYMAKVALYSDDFISAIIRRNHIEHLLFNAQFSTDFMLYYQPQFSTETGALIGMEALIRWYHIEEGFISPAEFIPTAEAIGMIPDLSTWIFETAMRQMRDWLSKYPKFNASAEASKPIRMGINVSALLFDSVDFLPQLEQHCKSLQVLPMWFDLEITETGALNANIHVENMFNKLSQMGFTISIDDFGTGYSALSYLKRFSVHTVKIAKELIDNIEVDSQDQLIVQAITMMSKGMSLKTIAEGVETVGQFDVLKRLGCDAIQGYYLGKPCAADQFEALYLNQSSAL